MEAIVRHVNKNKTIQDAIVSSENTNFINATYRLFLNYGFSMEYFIKAGFHYELGIQGVESIFRENRIMNHLIKEFFDMTGGKFDYIIDQILKISIQLKPKKTGYTDRSTKKVLSKCMHVLNEVLVHSMADSLIDFCSEVCLNINTQCETSDDRVGENIVCSFIIFRLLAPRLLELDCCGTSPPDKVLTVVKLLNRVASNNYCPFDENTTPIAELIYEQNQCFTATVARALMRHREANYCHLHKLSQVKHAQLSEIFLKALRDLELDKAPQIPVQIKSKPSEKRIQQQDSFDNLLEAALNNQQIANIGDDFEFFMLWSSKAVLKMVEMENLDIDFFKKWQLTGEDFMQLTPSSLKIMNMHDKDDIDAVMDCIDDLKTMVLYRETDLMSMSLDKWTVKELSLWLAISDLSYLIPLFKSLKMNGKQIVQLTIHDLAEMKIHQPKAVVKLMHLIQKHNSTTF